MQDWSLINALACNQLDCAVQGHLQALLWAPRTVSDKRYLALCTHVQWPLTRDLLNSKPTINIYISTYRTHRMIQI